jgi:hypothetical protein
MPLVVSQRLSPQLSLDKEEEAGSHAKLSYSEFESTTGSESEVTDKSGGGNGATKAVAVGKERGRGIYFKDYCSEGNAGEAKKAASKVPARRISL